jgi:hypothetical protein
LRRGGGGLLEQVGRHLGHLLLPAAQDRNASGSLGNFLGSQIGYPDRAQELSLSLRTGRGCSLHGLGSLPVLCFEILPFSRTLCLADCLAPRLADGVMVGLDGAAMAGLAARLTP